MALVGLKWLKLVMDVLSLAGYRIFLNDEQGHLLEISPNGKILEHSEPIFADVFHIGGCCGKCFNELEKKGFVSRYKVIYSGTLVKVFTFRVFLSLENEQGPRTIYVHALKSVMEALFIRHQNKFLRQLLVHKMANFLQQLVFSQGMMELQGTFEYLEYQRHILDKMSLVSFLSRAFPDVSDGLDEIISPTSVISLVELLRHVSSDLHTLHPQLTIINDHVHHAAHSKRKLLSLDRILVLMVLLDIMDAIGSTASVLMVTTARSSSRCVSITYTFEGVVFSMTDLIREIYSCHQVEKLEDIRFSGFILASYLLKQLGGSVMLKQGKKFGELTVTFELPSL